MIADVLDIFSVPRSARISRGILTAARIRSIFAETRADLGARSVHIEVKKRHAASNVVWSLWIGRFEKSVPWLLADRFQELRYAFLLLLEANGFVGLVGSNVGDVSDKVAEEQVSYQKLLALHSTADIEIDSLSTRTLRAARIGVSRSTQVGRHLEKSLSRVGASQAAPSQVSLRHADESWRISPGSGRVAVAGTRMNIPLLCAWFATTCESIDLATEPHEFIKAFAHPVGLSDLPVNVSPTALQLDSSVIDDLLDGGATFRREQVALTDPELDAVRQLVRELWIVEAMPAEDGDDNRRWRLVVGNDEVGELVRRSTKISFRSDLLGNVQVVHDDGSTETLSQIYNAGSQPFRLTFSDVTYAYASGQLFRDHRLLASRNALLEVLSGRLPANAAVEKAVVGGAFAPGSLFGFVADAANVPDEYLICDDIGTEWADFIGVSPAHHQVAFYHCKGGTVDVGASGLHEVVSQAAKNLGYLTPSTAELSARRARWQGTWNQTTIPRLQRGASVDAFIASFSQAVAAPQATRRVTLVTSSLSKAAVTAAFGNIDPAAPTPEVLHVLWLLSVFVDQCRVIGAVPEIICRP